MILVAVLSGWLAAVVGLALAFSLRRSLVQRMELVARASHELRGPLTAATLGLRLGELTAPRRRALELELGRAVLALEDLAAVDRRTKPERVVDAVDVQQLLTDSVEAWRPAARERRVGLKLRWSGGPLVVLGDRLRLAQATGNLIANAVEHGGGEVEVRGCAETTGIRVEVLDGGPGLSAPVAELARRGRRRRDPRGRGLAIASAIASDHGGRIAAAPSERGARLVMTLPAAGAIQTPSAGSSA